MLEAAQGGELLGRGVRIERVDLNDPAVAIRLVGLLGPVVTGIQRIPAVIAVGVLVAALVALKMGALLGIRVLGLVLGDIADAGSLETLKGAPAHSEPGEAMNKTCAFICCTNLWNR